MGKTVNDKSIFGEYSKPEDRVTTALLHVLQYGGHDLVSTVFEECGLPSNEVNIKSQVVEENSRPDGEISCDCHYHIYIESKIVQNALATEHGRTQLKNNRVLAASGLGKWLVYITPDETRPNELADFDDVIWINWDEIIRRLDGYTTSDTLTLFLVKQFKLLVEHLVYKKNIGKLSMSGLLSDEEEKQLAEKRVIIVGGSWGEDVALNYKFYGCQEDRFFQPAKYFTFCHQNRIKYLFEIEGTPEESVDLTTVGIDQQYFTDVDPNYSGNRKYFKLKLVHTFEPVIENDNRDKNGRRCAFTQKQTYTDYDTIMSAKFTSEL